MTLSLPQSGLANSLTMKAENEVFSLEETEPLNSYAESSSRHKHGPPRRLTFSIALLFVSISLNIFLVVNNVRKIGARQDFSPYGNTLFPSSPYRTIFFSTKILTSASSSFASRCANQVQLTLGLWPGEHHRRGTSNRMGKHGLERRRDQPR